MAHAGARPSQQVVAGSQSFTATRKQGTFDQVGVLLRRENHADRLPGDIKFVCEDLRLPCARALAHFQRGGNKRDHAVGIQSDPRR